MTRALLFSPHALGGIELRNRAVMAPMTRCRASNPDLAPDALHAEYYAQRASAGLILSEGTPVSPQGRGYAFTPGIYSPAQIAGWKQVTDAVHARGGRIFAQIWHVGRISHSSLRPDRAPPVGASAVRLDDEVFAFNDQGRPAPMPCDTPRMLATTEVRAIVGDFAQAARNARAAGFDGVEIHGANGYLFDQFRCPYLNQRTDEYGGSLQNRCRFLLEAAAAVAREIGGDRTGVRLSPLGLAHDMQRDPAPMTTYPYLARELDRIGVAYLHLYDQSATWIHDPHDALLGALRSAFPRTLMLCGGFDGDRAQAALAAGSGDLIAFGKPYISNPDLVERLRTGAPPAPWNASTFYGGTAAGYTDYPALAAAESL
jgi:N-ethylmaleimide reductase